MYMNCPRHIMKNMEARKGPRIEKTDLEGIYWAAQQAYTKAEHDEKLALLEISHPGNWF
jgi:hypothetical protein